MIAILNRWRQFGRRYFWPHLLFGMVAATFGLPVAQATGQSSQPETLSRSLNISRAAQFDGLALLQGSVRRPTCQVDYWHQHAIRTVIRHLSFSTLTPVSREITPDALPSEAQKLVLLDTLNVLLTHESRAKAEIVAVSSASVEPPVIWHPGLWLSQVQGTRAGPASLS